MVGPPVTVTVLVPPAVPLMVTPAPVKPLTGLLNTAVKLIGELLVGSAWPAAWSIVTVGGVVSPTVKLAALLAVPSEVVTLIGPLVAPAGTVAVIAVAEPTVKLALVPLNSTAEAPVKLVPLMVTVVPTGPLPGVKLEIVGGLMTVKLAALLAVPSEVVTLIGPLVAPAGTVAVIAVAEPTVKLALVPLNSTALAPVKLVPLMVTLVPTGPLLGVKLEIVGGLMTVKLAALLAVPSEVVTLIGPLVAPAGTVAVIAVAEPTVKLALVPLNSTALAPVKLVPLIVTLVPTGPLLGVKLEIVGGLMTVKLAALLAVPSEVVTLIGPLETPAGTVAVIAVAEPTVKLALVPLNSTALAPVKLVPLMVTLVPTGPLPGVKLEIVGGLITVKLAALLAVPPEVVTLIGPLETPAGTVVVIAVAELTVKLALTLLNSTAVAPLKLVPLIVTLVPTGPLLGVKLEIVGGLMTVKLAALLAVPSEVVTLIGPLVAPAGTVAVIAVAELTVKLALVPLNSTALAPVKLVPLMVTLVPTGPLPGVKLVIVGGLITVKLAALLAVPPGVVPLIGPLETPDGTVAVIDVAEPTVKLALVPLNSTALAPVKLVPLMVTLVPTGPMPGVKLVIVGGLITVKLAALLAVPPGVVTLIGPLVALPAPWP